MKKIKLSNNKFAIVDDFNFDWLNKWKWTYDRGYARRNISIGYINGKYKTKKVYMHQLIKDFKKDCLVDHINKNGLDNRINNLRFADKSLNALNSKTPITNKSGCKGISWSNSCKKWLCRIVINKKTIHLGMFIDFNDACNTRKEFENNYLKNYGNN